MAPSPLLQLNRLKIVGNKHVVYDQSFHSGVNIIRGENGSGKSTIADFIFYVLGGKIHEWKEEASKCDFVYAEIETFGGILTLERRVQDTPDKTRVFFGDLENSEKHAPEKWELFSTRRSPNNRSFSQMMFKAIGIPEAQGETGNNVTMHQILRLLYADQQTAVKDLFKDEQFDPSPIRKTVGELLCGIVGYEELEIDRKLRELEKIRPGINGQLKALIAVLPSESAQSPDELDAQITKLSEERDKLVAQIESPIPKEDKTHHQAFNNDREVARKKLIQLRRSISELKSSSEYLDFEIQDLENLTAYLKNSKQKLAIDEKFRSVIGDVKFEYCPSCNKPLLEQTDEEKCHLCGNEIDGEESAQKYRQISEDIEWQIIETGQLLEQEQCKHLEVKKSIKLKQNEANEEQIKFFTRFESNENPNDKMLAEVNQRIGGINSDLAHLEKNKSALEKYLELKRNLDELDSEISRLENELEGKKGFAKKQRDTSLTAISKQILWFLRNDLKRQEEFQSAQSVELDFGGDTVSIDGRSNFAESSNVILKNATFLGMLLAACHDDSFLHPKFLLMDNIEDKGMEPERSQNFQQLIVNRLSEVTTPHQVIFTTSMMNTDLEKFAVGHNYTHESRILDF